MSQCKPLFGLLNDLEISNLTGICSSSVQEYRVELGLTKVAPPDHPKKIDLTAYKSFLGLTTDQHLSDFIGCSIKVVRKNRVKLGIDSFSTTLKNCGADVKARELKLKVAEYICKTKLFTRYLTPKGIFLSGTSVALAFTEISANNISLSFRDPLNLAWRKEFD